MYLTDFLRATVVASFAFGLHAQAADHYPNHPIRLIVPFAPGGGTDIVARATALKMGEVLKQTVVVDNRGGAGGVIGMGMIVRAPPDGCTLGLGTGSIATSAALTKLPYDPVKDVQAISMIAETGYLLVIHPSLPVKTTRELIAYAKANPSKVTYGSSGTGGTAHLAGELLDLLAGTKMTHVPYKSSGPALTDLLGGQISMIYGSLPVIVPQMSSGRFRVIANTTLKRSRRLPDIPTVAESGVPGYDTTTYFCLIGPKGMPNELLSRLQTALKDALQSKELKDRFEVDGLEVPEMGSAYLERVIKADIEKWTRVVKAANIRVSN
jgi:tripartite-type tricarboxylate transporter receptor subunit TctC